MADNKPILDGTGASFTGATKEYSDGAHGPKVALTDGSTSPITISPATATLQGTTNTKLDTLTAKLPAALSAGGFLKVSVEASAVTFTVTGADLVTDNAAFTDGTTKVRPAGFVFDEVAGTALTENDAGAARMDSKRAQVVVLEDETTRGRRLTITAANALKTDPSGVTAPISVAALPLPSGAATSAKQDTLAALLPAALSGGGFLKVSVEASAVTFTISSADLVADNGAFVDGTTKVSAAGLIFDEVAGTALTENDIGAARMDSKRAAVLVIEDETTRGRRLIITAANAAKVDGSGVTQPISAAALPLPSGAATSAKQDTLAALLPASLGQKVMAASLAVTFASDQSALTVAKGNVSNTTATIANAASLSGAIDLAGSRLAFIDIPASFEGGAIEFQLAVDGTNYADLKDEYGGTVRYVAASSTVVRLPYVDWYGARYIKIRSATTAGVATPQASDATLKLGLVPL